MNNQFLPQILQGATPSIEQFVAELGDRLPLLQEYQSTPQDREWHAEGNVYIHVGMVLEELYQILQRDAIHLAGERRLSLILGALLHDIAKPMTTKEQEINGMIRTVAPRHARKGRSYLALKLMGMGLSYSVVETTLGLVGYHHDPKQLVTHDAIPGQYHRLARLADPELLYWLELADLRGRECQDQQQQLDYIEMYRLYAQEYEAWQHLGTEYQAWQTYFAQELQNWTQDTQDFVFNQAIARREAGIIFTPEAELARSYSYRESFPRVVLTFGVSGSGKSTWIANNLQDYQVISLDNLRQQIAKSRSDQTKNSEVIRQAKEQLKSLLRNHNKNQIKIVWDATNLRRDFRQQVISISRDYGAFITLVIFQCPETIYRDRNQQRQHSIPEDVLQQQLATLEFPELDEGDRTLIVDENGKILAQHSSCINPIALL